MKQWDAKELITKYPIKNVWEWEFTGNVITSKKRLFDIKDDPWNRNFMETRKTFTVDEMGLLVYGYTKVENRQIRLWSCV
jgi:hypothetical protein